MESHHPSDMVLRCFDPFGRDVVARSGRRESHIEDGHLELDEFFGALEATFRHSAWINAAATHANRDTFYRRGVLPPHDRLYLKVCVGYGPGTFYGAFAVGTVITAYPTKEVGRGEAQRWP